MRRSIQQVNKGIKARKFTATIIKVDPATAKHMLRKNKRNRKLVKSKVAKMVADMKDGLWSRTGEAISFKKDGELLSGQHRLTAVVESGTTQEFTVAFCADNDATMYEGMGSRFTPNDHLARNGFKELSKANGGAIIRHMRHAFRTPRGSMRPSEVISFARKYKDAIKFAADCFEGQKNNKITIAPVLAVIARAAWAKKSKRSDIKRFCSILKDGAEALFKDTGATKEDRNRMPLKLRDELISRRNQKGADIMETYRKTETALDLFIQGKTGSLIASRQELFPIPADERPQEVMTADKRYFCLPSRALVLPKHNGLDPSTIKRIVKNKAIPLKGKTMTRVMRPNDKVCVTSMGKTGGFGAKLVGSIKKVNFKGRKVEISLKDVKQIRGPLFASIKSGLAGGRDKMSPRQFGMNIHALQEREFDILTAE